MTRLDIAQLTATIDALLVRYPELTGEDETLRADMLEGSTDIVEVFGRILVQMREAAIGMAGIDKIMSELNERGKRFARKHDALRELIAKIMEHAGLTKFVMPEATLSISFRKGSPIITDETALPEECWRVKREPDKAMIKRWVDAGNVPDGVAISNGSSVLTVRVK
jgi:hypothetical protein